MPRYCCRPVALAILLFLILPRVSARADSVQKQVPIPGLTLEESVRLETASQKLQELTSQRARKNQARQLFAAVAHTANRLMRPAAKIQVRGCQSGFSTPRYAYRRIALQRRGA